MYDGHRLIDTLIKITSRVYSVRNWVMIVKTTRDQTPSERD